MAIPFWIHPVLTVGVLACTGMAVYFGRKSAKAPTESYQPILRKHLMFAIPAVALACVAVVLGPYVMDESGLDALETLHAAIGLTAVSLWIAQTCFGWMLWNEKEKFRKLHRYNGFLIIGLALLQAPFGLKLYSDFCLYYC